MIKLYPAVYEKDKRAMSAIMSVKAFPKQEFGEGVFSYVYHYIDIKEDEQNRVFIGTLPEIHAFLKFKKRINDFVFCLLFPDGEVCVHYRHLDEVFEIASANVVKEP